MQDPMDRVPPDPPFPVDSAHDFPHPASGHPLPSTGEGLGARAPRLEHALLDLPVVRADGRVVLPMVRIYIHEDGTAKAGGVYDYEIKPEAAPADEIEGMLRRNVIHEIRLGRYADAAAHLSELMFVGADKTASYGPTSKATL